MFLILFSILQTNRIQTIPKHLLFKKVNGQLIDVYNELDVAITKSKAQFSREAFKNATENTSSIDVATLKSLAKNDFGPALFFLGDMYLYGIDPISINLTKAAHYYKKAAIKNITSAYTQLGFLYTYGLGVEKNIPKAVVYHRIGCERKSSYSCLWEAHAHRYGVYKAKSSNHALSEIYPIALLVNQLSLKNAVSHHKPEIITRSLKLKEHKSQDDSGILQLLQYKAAFGDPDAEMDLAHSYYYGNYGQEVNIHKAREIFERHLDNSDAAVHLGRIHHLGEDGPVDLELAEHYYKMAADMDNMNAFNNLGVIHNDRNDPDVALELMQKAADKGHPSAKFNLAMHEIRGRKNLTKGLQMLRELSDSGMVLAALNYATYERGGIAPYDEDDAFWLFHSICSVGPWREESLTAESYYKNGSYDAALLLWMQLSDQGQCQASFNAGLVLTNWEKVTKGQPFLIEGYDKFHDDFDGSKLRGKMAVRMLKNAMNYCNDDISPYLYDIYMKRNMTSKAIKFIEKHGTGTESSFIKIKLMLKEELPLKFMEIKKEFTNGLENNIKSIFAFASLIPWIGYKFIQRGIEIAQNEHYADEYFADFSQFVVFLWKKIYPPFEILCILDVLITLIRKRFEIIYYG